MKSGLGSNIALLAALATPLAAEALDLDPSFGNAGVKLLEFGDAEGRVTEVRGLLPDGSGGWYAYGDAFTATRSRELYLGRFDGDGERVTGFGVQGLRRLGTTASETAGGFALTRDGRLLLAATRNPGPGGQSSAGVVYRLSAAGSLDTGFDFDGERVLGEDAAEQLQVAAGLDGRVFAARVGADPFPATLERLNAQGQALGEAIPLPRAGFQSWVALPAAAAPLSDGGAAIIGTIFNSVAIDQATQFFCVVWRVDDEGDPVPGFGLGGVQVLSLLPGVNSSCSAVAVDGESILLGGAVRRSGEPDQAAIARIAISDGAFDASFGTAGRLSAAIGEAEGQTVSEAIPALALRSTGTGTAPELLVLYTLTASGDSARRWLALGRFDAVSGQPVEGFGNDGRRVFSADAIGSDSVRGRVLQTAAKGAVVIGGSWSGARNEAVLIRLRGPELFANGFETTQR